MKTSDFRQLRVWQQAMDIVVDTYAIIKTLPIEERFSLCDQMRRSSVSIPSNIAEGQSRNSSKEFIHFLSISRGSIAELQTQLILCVRLGYIEDEIVTGLLSRLKDNDKMIGGLMKAISMNNTFD
ncbi:MAG: four helix bundle protein [Muribaculaceae bacterium]|nr:four helix bundle protein [Muribaculaceae bacterium]